DDVEPGHQRMLLEHDAAIGARAGDGPAIELDLTFGGGEKAGDAIEQPRFAAARRADGDHELAIPHGQVDVAKRLDRAVLGRVSDAEVADVELGHPAIVGANSFARGEGRMNSALRNKRRRTSRRRWNVAGRMNSA